MSTTPEAVMQRIFDCIDWGYDLGLDETGEAWVSEELRNDLLADPIVAKHIKFMSAIVGEKKAFGITLSHTIDWVLAQDTVKDGQHR